MHTCMHVYMYVCTYVCMYVFAQRISIIFHTLHGNTDICKLIRHIAVGLA